MKNFKEQVLERDGDYRVCNYESVGLRKRESKCIEGIG